jgi:tetratricopeptide (TPR) repeat protein
MFRRGCAALVGLLVGLSAFGSSASDILPVLRAGLRRATEALLNRDLEAAALACGRLLAHPDGGGPGHFCWAMVTLVRAEDQDDPASHLDRFRAQIGDAVAATERLERRFPRQADVKLLLGLAYGGKALADGERRNYLDAYGALREAHRRFQEALHLQPGLVDAHYGIGLYEYGLGRVPRFLRPLAGMVLPPGDPDAGLRRLEQVAAEGDALRGVARMALLSLYAGPERRHADAWRLGRELVRDYPGNPDAYFAAANAASELGKFSEALEIARQVRRRIADGAPAFPPELWARQLQLLGKIYMDRRDHMAALALFRQAIRSPIPPRFRWVAAWAWTRSGMIHDLLGDRAEAVRSYRQAVAADPESLAAETARRHLDTPYAGRSPAD